MILEDTEVAQLFATMADDTEFQEIKPKIEAADRNLLQNNANQTSQSFSALATDSPSAASGGNQSIAQEELRQ